MVGRGGLVRGALISLLINVGLRPCCATIPRTGRCVNAQQGQGLSIRIFSAKLRSRFVISRNANARAGIRIPSHDRA